MIYITKNNSSVVVYNDKDNIRKTIPLSKVEMVSDKSDIIVLRWYETQKPFIQFRWDEYAPTKDIALNKLDNLLYGCGGGGGGTADCSEVEAELLEARHEITELQYQIDHYDCSQYATEHKNELLADWTGDANITPSRVLAGYSGYANGQKVVGSYVPPTGGDCSEVEALLQDAQGRIEDLENDLTAKDATINGLENDLNAANNTIGQKDRRITSLETTNQALGNQIDELEADLTACNTAGAQKDAQIANKDAEIDSLIEQLSHCGEGGLVGRKIENGEVMNVYENDVFVWVADAEHQIKDGHIATLKKGSTTHINFKSGGTTDVSGYLTDNLYYLHSSNKYVTTIHIASIGNQTNFDNCVWAIENCNVYQYKI